MKLKNFILLNVVAFIFLAMVSVSVAGEYKIGAGDVLEISVWKNIDLTQKLVVLPDGTVRFPLIGQLEVEGKSVVQLEKEVKEKLKKYVPDPVLLVSVLQVNSMMIYVIGKVNRSGRFEIRKNIDVLQALALAGGLIPYARGKEIGIFRKIDGTTTTFNFNYKEVLEGVNLGQNIMLQRGDVIVVR